MPMLVETEMARINRLIVMGGYSGMTELQFFAAEIDEWKRSQKRKEQITGDAYYEGFHDILQRKRTIIGEDGKLQEVDNLPNNKLVDNQFALMVDQKTNYLVGKPFTVTCKNKTYADLLTKVFDKRFNRLLKYVCEDALKGGLAGCSPIMGIMDSLPSSIFPPKKFFRFGLTMITQFLIVQSGFIPKRFGTGSPRKLWNGWKSSSMMVFGVMCMMEPP